MTDRISVSKTSPSTGFYLEADRISQSVAGNYTKVRCYLRCVNLGNTSSFSGFPGDQIGSIDGIGEFGRRSGNPFLPSGVGNGVTRWRIGPFDVNVPHNADGTRGAITLRQGLYYDGGGVAQDNTASFNDFPAIPRGPSVEFDGAWAASQLQVEFDGAWETALTYVEFDGAWVLAS